jgi:rubrerythrin
MKGDMYMSIKGSKTEKNLLKSFAGESQARNRYTYFASAVRKEGLEQVAAIFEETANQEKEHAKRMFKFLEGGELEITASYPAGVIGTAAENLKASAEGENFEHTKLYPDFAKVAREEGFTDVAAMYENISIAEQHHERRYLALLKNLEGGVVFKRDKNAVWTCRNCGYTHEGAEPPKTCPACLHPTSYFQLLSEIF